MPSDLQSVPRSSLREALRGCHAVEFAAAFRSSQLPHSFSFVLASRLCSSLADLHAHGMGQPEAKRALRDAAGVLAVVRPESESHDDALRIVRVLTAAIDYSRV